MEPIREEHDAIGFVEASGQIDEEVVPETKGKPQEEPQIIEEVPEVINSPVKEESEGNEQVVEEEKK